MTLQGWLQIGLTLLIGLRIGIPVGRYLARVTTDRKTPLDRLFDPIDNFLYQLNRAADLSSGDGLEAYTLHVLATTDPLQCGKLRRLEPGPGLQKPGRTAVGGSQSAGRGATGTRGCNASSGHADGVSLGS
jgi:hypothetical protein